MEFLTIRQAARRGPLNESALRRMVRQGTIPGFKTGNRFLIDYAGMLNALGTLAQASMRRDDKGRSGGDDAI